jgi:PEGA domain
MLGLNWDDDEAVTLRRRWAPAQEDLMPTAEPSYRAGPLRPSRRSAPSAGEGLWDGDELQRLSADWSDHPAWSWGDTRPRSPRPALVPQSARPQLSRLHWLAAVGLALATAVLTWQLLPRSGDVQIELSGPNAPLEVDVQVDGESRCGVTPCVVRDLSAGHHAITIVTPDGERLSKRHVVRAGERARVQLGATARPRPVLGQGVELRSRLPHVRVYVDGRRRGELPILIDDLPSGEHRLRLVAPNRRPLERVITVQPSRVERLHGLMLAPVKGSARIALASPGARVLVGEAGKRRGRRALHGPWPRTLELDTERRWELVAGGAGYRAKVIPIEFDDQGEAEVTVRLVSAGWSADELYE